MKSKLALFAALAALVAIVAAVRPAHAQVYQTTTLAAPQTRGPVVATGASGPCILAAPGNWQGTIRLQGASTNTGPWTTLGSLINSGTIPINLTGSPSYLSLLGTFTNGAPQVTLSCVAVTNALGLDPTLCTGSGHDDSVAVQAAITTAQASGVPATITIPFAHCYFASTVNVTASNIHITGLSSGVNQYPGTEITWTGATGATTGPLFNFYPGGTRALESSDLSNVYLDSNSGHAGKGLIVNSVQNGNWLNVSFNAFQGVAFTCTETGTLTGQGSSLRNLFSGFNLFNYSTNTGTGILLTQGSPTDNADCNQNNFFNVFVGNNKGVGIDVQTADHNLFINTQVFTAGGGTGTGFLFDCYSAYNVLISSTLATLISYGTADCGGAGNVSKFNRLEDYDTSSSATPVINAGASLTWSDLQGTLHQTTGTFSSTITAGGPIQSAALSNSSTTQGTVPPAYTAAGATTPSTVHIVQDTITAGGVSTTVTLSGAAVFTGAIYTCVVFNYNSGLPVAAALLSSSTFSFPSVGGNTYIFTCSGI